MTVTIAAASKFAEMIACQPGYTICAYDTLGQAWESDAIAVNVGVAVKWNASLIVGDSPITNFELKCKDIILAEWSIAPVTVTGGSTYNATYTLPFGSKAT